MQETYYIQYTTTAVVIRNKKKKIRLKKTVK